MARMLLLDLVWYWREKKKNQPKRSCHIYQLHLARRLRRRRSDILSAAGEYELRIGSSAKFILLLGLSLCKPVQKWRGKLRIARFFIVGVLMRRVL